MVERTGILRSSCLAVARGLLLSLLLLRVLLLRLPGLRPAERRFRHRKVHHNARARHHEHLDPHRQTLPHYGLMYAMVSATEVAICAACKAVVQLRVPILGVFSGTTMESPGFKAALSGLPAHHPELFLEAITDPSARTTNTASLSAT